MLAHGPARLAGGVGDVADGEAGGPEPLYGLAGALDGLLPDVERPVQVHQQPLEMHVPIIAGYVGGGYPRWGWRRMAPGVALSAQSPRRGPSGCSQEEAPSRT